MNSPKDRERQGVPRRRRAGAAWLGAAVVVGLGVCGAVLWACSVERNYKTLSFFFDGVPDPSAPSKPRGGGVAFVDIQQSPTYSAHKPWVEERCEECHTRTLRMGGRDSALCLKCHAGKTTDHERMHGPVAVGACLWCHSPHNSAYAHLLKGPAVEVCAQCHAPAGLDARKVPAHAERDRSCLECHYGHGGGERFFLRTGGDAKPGAEGGTTPAP